MAEILAGIGTLLGEAARTAASIALRVPLGISTFVSMANTAVSNLVSRITNTTRSAAVPVARAEKVIADTTSKKLEAFKDPMSRIVSGLKNDTHMCIRDTEKKVSKTENRIHNNARMCIRDTEKKVSGAETGIRNNAGIAVKDAKKKETDIITKIIEEAKGALSFAGGAVFDIGKALFTFGTSLIDTMIGLFMIDAAQIPAWLSEIQAAAEKIKAQT